MDDQRRTCPACLSRVRLDPDAKIVRHGFRAFNVRHGMSGGWHSDPCLGTGAPMFESPAGRDWARGLTSTLASQLSTLESMLEAQRAAGDATYQLDVGVQTLRLHVVALRAAIHSWVEDQPPKQTTRCVHAALAPCKLRGGRPAVNSNNPADVTCTSCQQYLQEEQAARNELPDLDALFILLVDTATRQNRPPAWIDGRVSALQAGRKIKLEGLSEAMRAAACAAEGKSNHLPTRMVRSYHLRGYAHDRSNR